MRDFVLMGRSAGRRAWLVPFVPGLALMAFGLLIAMFPQLLVALVAGLFVIGGLGLMSMGWRLRALGSAAPPMENWRSPDQP